MVCCAVAYHRLNSWQASAAAPVEWVARGLSPIIGFAVGILVLDDRADLQHRPHHLDRLDRDVRGCALALLIAGRHALRGA